MGANPFEHRRPAPARPRGRLPGKPGPESFAPKVLADSMALALLLAVAMVVEAPAPAVNDRAVSGKGP